MPGRPRRGRCVEPAEQPRRRADRPRAPWAGSGCPDRDRRSGPPCGPGCGRRHQREEHRGEHERQQGGQPPPVRRRRRHPHGALGPHGVPRAERRSNDRRNGPTARGKARGTERGEARAPARGKARAPARGKARGPAYDEKQSRTRSHARETPPAGLEQPPLFRILWTTPGLWTTHRSDHRHRAPRRKAQSRRSLGASRTLHTRPGPPGRLRTPRHRRIRARTSTLAGPVRHPPGASAARSARARRGSAALAQAARHVGASGVTVIPTGTDKTEPDLVIAHHGTRERTGQPARRNT